jgi:hypothetical protein
VKLSCSRLKAIVVGRLDLRLQVQFNLWESRGSDL